MARVGLIVSLCLAAATLAPAAGGQELPPVLPPVDEMLDTLTAPTSPPTEDTPTTSRTDGDASSTSSTSTADPSTDGSTGTDGSTTGTPPPLVVDGTTERALIRLINESRSVVGRRPLRSFKRLAGIARRHSARMAARGGIFHGLKRTARQIRNWDWVSLGENVGVGRTVDSLHRAFMNSAPHRRNILKRGFRRVGVGMVAADSRIWVTVIFYR